MGTTMAFYYIQNSGYDRERLQTGLSRISGGESASAQFEKMMIGLVGEKMFRLAQQEVRAAKQHNDSIFGRRPELPSPMVAYRPDAAWLPFFDRDICEGYNASSKDVRRLSKAFQAPVLAISLFDSDILMLSYSDEAEKIAYDYAKPNCEGMEEYDSELFQAAFPQFLLELCKESEERRLREIWDGEEVFADDRMAKLSEFLGAVPLYDTVPDGFEVITL